MVTITVHEDYGFLTFKDGKTVAFCDVYQFRASTNNAPIQAITTYAIALA